MEWDLADGAVPVDVVALFLALGLFSLQIRPWSLGLNSFHALAAIVPGLVFGVAVQARNDEESSLEYGRYYLLGSSVLAAVVLALSLRRRGFPTGEMALVFLFAVLSGMVLRGFTRAIRSV